MTSTDYTTSTAGTEDWLRATANMTIWAYTEYERGLGAQESRIAALQRTEQVSGGNRKLTQTPSVPAGR